MKAPRWFLYHVHNEDDVHLDPLPQGRTPAQDVIKEKYLRPLEPGLYDLPGPSTCLREGYVLASSEEEARDRVAY